MWGILKDFASFLWRRDSDSACCLIIDLAERMSIRHQREMGEYLLELHKVNKKFRAS